MSLSGVRWSCVALPLLVAFAGSVSGCRGKTSPLPPIRIHSDMFRQPKVLPESASNFFSDGSAMRLPPPGAVSREEFRGDDILSRGTSKSGYVAQVPIPVDDALLDRGQERFDIFCAPCHDRAGSGQGIVVQRGFPTSVDLSSEHTRNMRDGEIFHTIGAGVRNMPGYRFQVPVRDRWAITAWVRVLQHSQHALMADAGGAAFGEFAPVGESP